jgi:hypothetical protein
MTRFKRQLHINIVNAIIKTLEDEDGTHEEVKKYFIDAEKGIKIALAFCPNKADMIEIFKIDLEHHQKYEDCDMASSEMTDGEF